MASPEHILDLYCVQLLHLFPLKTPEKHYFFALLDEICSVSELKSMPSMPRICPTHSTTRKLYTYYINCTTSLHT